MLYWVAQVYALFRNTAGTMGSLSSDRPYNELESKLLKGGLERGLCRGLF